MLASIETSCIQRRQLHKVILRYNTLLKTSQVPNLLLITIGQMHIIEAILSVVVVMKGASVRKRKNFYLCYL